MKIAVADFRLQIGRTHNLICNLQSDLSLSHASPMNAAIAAVRTCWIIRSEERRTSGWTTTASPRPSSPPALATRWPL